MNAAIGIMKHAAALLRSEARSIRDSCAVGKDAWACPDCGCGLRQTCGPRRAYDDMLNTARELSAIAKKCEKLPEFPAVRTAREE
jgi:hypothetical protein